MEEIGNEVMLLAQLDLEVDTEDTDQPVQNLAEELAIENLMEVEAQKLQRSKRQKNSHPKQQDKEESAENF